MATLADEIHAALRQCASDAAFPQVSYPAGARNTSDSVFLQPKTILAKPLSSTWATPELNRQRYFLERATWLWELRLDFDREVSTEEFEDSLTNALLRIPRTESKPQVDLILEECEYRHPPEQQPAGGTSAVYRIRAEISPL